MSSMKQLLEAVDKYTFAGEPEQKPGDQVRGTDKAKPRKDHRHPFAGKLVGGCEESIMLELDKTAKATSMIRRVKEAYEQVENSEPKAAPKDTVAKTWNQLNRQERTSGVKGRTIWNPKIRKYQVVFDVPAKPQQVKEYGATPGAPSTTGGAQNPDAQTTAANVQKSMMAKNNLSKIASVDKNINPQQANQALMAMGNSKNTNTPITGPQLRQTKQLADLVGDALSDPTKGSQVANLLQQVARKQGQ